MKPVKSFKEVWPKGLSELLDALRAAGFKPEANAAAENISPTGWGALNRVRSSDVTQPENNFYTYLSAESRVKLSSGWGLIFADKKIAQKLDPNLPVVATDFPDSVVDYILRRTTLTQWSGRSHPVPNHVQIEEYVVIGPDCEIAEGVILETGVRLGARVKIKKNTRIGAHSRIADDCEIGEDCHFTASVSIGGPGFGFVYYPGRPAREQRVHIGRVVIGDRVRLGAFVAIDRGVFEDTHVGNDVAIDNIVQVAHNCAVGQSTTLCGFVGLTGSTTLGKNVTFGGLVFTKGHLSVGDNVTIAGWSGVISNVKPNQVLKGYPVRPLSDALKVQVLTDKLPELYERIKKLEKALNPKKLEE